MQEGGERQRRSGAAWPCSLHELGHAGGPARAPPRELGRAPWRVSSSSVSRARPCHGGLLELGRIWRPWRGMCASGKGGARSAAAWAAPAAGGRPCSHPIDLGQMGEVTGVCNEGKIVISSALYYYYPIRRTEMANRETKFTSMANWERKLFQWQIGKHCKF